MRSCVYSWGYNSKGETMLKDSGMKNVQVCLKWPPRKPPERRERTKWLVSNAELQENSSENGRVYNRASPAKLTRRANATLKTRGKIPQRWK